MEKLWNVRIDFGRMGELVSTFIATDEDIEKLRGKTLYMSDVLGKHSEISLDFDDEFYQHCILEIPVSQDTVNDLKKACGGDLINGNFDPFEVLDV